MGTNASSATRDAQKVLDGIRRIVQSLHAASRESERRLGLTAAQLFVLRSVAGEDGLSINALADRTFTHQSSVSVVVSRLEARRFVVRQVDRKDGRRRLIVLTARGRRVLAAAPSARQERLVRAVLAMRPPLRRTVARALDRMADAMAAGRRPGMFLEEGGRS